METTRKTSRTVQKACLAAVLTATTGGAPALDGGRIVRVAADDHPANAQARSAPEAAIDSAITSTIKTKLLLTIRDLKSTAGIQVKTRDGIVNVSGTVPSKQQHDIAIETIRSVDGVRSIHDSLKVATR